MICTCALAVGSLLTLWQAPYPQTGDYGTVVSCSKQGSACDSVWIEGYPNPQHVYHQRNTNGTVPSDGNGVALPNYTVGGVVYGGPPVLTGPNPPCAVNTDDAQSPNYAAVWVAVNNQDSGRPQIPFCSVNGYNPFPVGKDTSLGLWRQASTAWVAVSRNYVTYNSGSYMAVAVAWLYNSGTVYAQVFLVTVQNGLVAHQGNPVALNTGRGSGLLQLGGIAGDDFGNFVVAYVRQQQQGMSNGVGTFVSGFNGVTLVDHSTLGFAEFYVASSSIYNYSRVACYHGTSATSGDFAVAWNGGDALTSAHYRTNWTSSPTLVVNSMTSTPPLFPFQQTYTHWMFSIACVRNKPGNYVLISSFHD